MLVAAHRRHPGLWQARPRGRPALHHQDHGGEDAVARRHHARDACSRSPTGSRRSSRSCRISTTCSSYTKPGESVVFVNLKDTTRAADVPDLWYQVRKKIDDIRQTLPLGRQGPVLQRRVRRHLFADLRAHRRTASPTASCATTPSACAPSCCACPTSPRSTCIGAQDEKIYLEFSTQQMAALGLDVNALMQTLQAQNAMHAERHGRCRAPSASPCASRASSPRKRA